MPTEMNESCEIYLNFGPLLKGESKADRRDGWIDIFRWAFDVAQLGRPYAGKGFAKSEFRDIKISKYVDRASPNLMHACAVGKVFKEVSIEQCKRGDKKSTAKPFLMLKLGNVYVSSYDVEADGDRYPRENFALNYEKIRYTYVEQNPDGSLSSLGIESEFDIERRVDQDGG